MSTEFSNMMTGTKGFENKYYKPEWMQEIPKFENNLMVSSGRFYKDGSYTLKGDGTKIVYDGAQNYCGMIMPDGSFVTASPNAEKGSYIDEYNTSFLQSAKEN